MSNDVNNNNYDGGDAYSYHPRNRRTTPAKSKQKAVADKKGISKKAVIIPAAVIAVLLGGVTALSMSMPKNKAAANVYVNDINVGGMNEAEVAAAVKDMITEDNEFTVTCSGNTATLSAKDIELRVDGEETAKQAINVGKSKNIFKNAYYAIKLRTGKQVINFVPEYNQELLDKALFDFGTTFNGASTGPSYDYSDTSVTISPGTPGQNPDTSEARKQFLEAVSQGKTSDIAVNLTYAEPQVLKTDEIYDEICKSPQDAYYEKNDKGGISIKEEVVGIELDKNDLKTAVDKVNAGEKATVPATVIHPEKTKAKLEANLFSATLGSYNSDFSSSSANRADNVKKAAASINGKILMPGDTFSYNSTIGNPSLANGYKVAPVFENGKSSQGVGGGVCQVSSTLYCAVLYADLAVTERHNHSLTVGYVPNGQDATVSYGSLDFKFKNNTDYPIKISSVVNGRKLTISIIGAKYTPSRKIEITNKTVSTIAPTSKETVDPSLPAGTRKVTSKGKNGYVVDTYKTVYEDGVKKSSNKITRSTYKMTPEEVSVGSGTSAETSAPAALPSGGNIGGLLPEEGNSVMPSQTQQPENTPNAQENSESAPALETNPQ